MQPSTSSASLRSCRRVLAAALLCGAAPLAFAQFASVPTSAIQGGPSPSAAAAAKDYRVDAARHVYASFPSRILKGKLPPLIYAVMITDTEIDATGRVVNVSVARPPAAAKEVEPWVVSLIRNAAPFPAPVKLAGSSTVVYREIWLVDRTGTFQVDTLTEGQR
jgi:periplasmic protein TonB